MVTQSFILVVRWLTELMGEGRAFENDPSKQVSVVKNSETKVVEEKVSIWFSLQQNWREEEVWG